MTLHVEAAGALVTVQDRGRTGFAHLGVPRAGALDAPAAELANRLVGNDPGAAVLEVVLGGLTLRADRGCWVAATGAPAPMRVADVPRGHARAEWVPAGARLSIGTPRTGLRTYLAVAGGVAVDPVLGSRSTDTLAWVGPEPVVAGEAHAALGRLHARHRLGHVVQQGRQHQTAPGRQLVGERRVEHLAHPARAAAEHRLGIVGQPQPMRPLRRK